MEKVTLQDAGTYSCMARSRVQNTERVSSSTEVLLTVKVRVSKPRISFSISKEGNDYLGNVTCWSSKGTPPVNFSLTLDGREFGRSTATDSLTAWFPVTMAPELDMGMAQCRATNPVQDLVSEPVTLVVVPVGGDVIVEVDYLYGVDSKLAAARLSCRIGRGTFPHVSWLLNASVLSETPVDPHGQPLLSRYGLADSGRTLFLTSLGPEESGYYRCRARDSYDVSGPWVESEAVLVKVTEFPITTIESITIVFCLLLLLSLVLSVFCLCKMYLQELPQQTPELSEETLLKKGELGSAAMLAFLFAATLGLCYCSSDNSTEVILDRPRLSGPSEALDGTVITIECALPSYPRNQTILLQLYKEGNHDKLLGEFSVLHKGNASIPIFVRPKHEGNLECVAKAQGQPKHKTYHRVKYQLSPVQQPVSGVKIDIVSDATEFFEGAKLELLCQHSVGSHVSFEWRLNGQPVSRSGYRDAHLVINRTSPEDSGSYTCVATNNFNKHRELVSNPEISFEVIKEDSHSYSAAVTCRSAKGTPPVTFSLYNRTQLLTNTTTEDGEATLMLPLVLGVNADWLQCRANNGDRTVYSQWIPIEVVPVSGPVTMTYDYDVGENYAVIGLKYRWFLNETLLNDSGSFYYVVNRPPEQSILLLSVGRRSAGTYRCEVRDSFDDSSAISSKRLFVSKEVLNRLPVVVVAAVFGAFAVLVVMVSACCCFVMMFRRRECGIKPRPDLEMITTVPSCEDELDSSDFGEDYDLINAARDAEFDQSGVFYSSRWLLNPELRPRDAHKRNSGDFQDLHVVDSSSCPVVTGCSVGSGYLELRNQSCQRGSGAHGGGKRRKYAGDGRRKCVRRFARRTRLRFPQVCPTAANHRAFFQLDLIAHIVRDGSIATVTCQRAAYRTSCFPWWCSPASPPRDTSTLQYSPEPKCIFNQNDSACHYAVGIGVIGFLACVAFLLLDVYLPFVNNEQQKKYAIMADLGFSGVWAFLWFVCFCLLANQWSNTQDTRGIPMDAARATVAFSFFSIATWGILTYFAVGRFRRGDRGATIPTYVEPPPDLHTPYPPTYAPTTYTPPAYTAYPSSVSDQQPPFTSVPQPQGDTSYQPPNY
ncbi:hypothetical protein fugu_007722 [Takifugu bimaculatus]|uniref:Ig-like domain-containing protein n=1 Tax=Takifugu bimaculatus TaxID=433685 RepID=A0A4Z2AZI4_9TELE|nr:hypothetical protein fugu_007722 [Takifugu bimaculatus]